MLVLSVAATKIHFEEQALMAHTKQSRQANKVVRPGGFVVPATSACSLKWMFWHHDTHHNKLKSNNQIAESL